MLLVRALQGLTPEQLDLRTAPHQWAIWQLAGHIAGARTYWFYDWMGEGDPAVRDLFRVTSTTVPDLPLTPAGGRRGHPGKQRAYRRPPRDVGCDRRLPTPNGPRRILRSRSPSTDPSGDRSTDAGSGTPETRHRRRDFANVEATTSRSTNSYPDSQALPHRRLRARLSRPDPASRPLRVQLTRSDGPADPQLRATDRRHQSRRPQISQRVHRGKSRRPRAARADRSRSTPTPTDPDGNAVTLDRLLTASEPGGVRDEGVGAVVVR